MTQGNGASARSRLFQARTAVRHNLKARIALDGPTGSGKTWSALEVAKGLAPGGRVLVIDTERDSAALYADHFKFDVVPWNPPYDPIALGDTVADAGETYDVVVVDSLSHYWTGEGGTLDVVDNAKARVKNGFAAWKSGTETQDYLVGRLLGCGAHLIVTMRSKMAYAETKDEDGRTTITKLGLQPIQREGLEYELTVVGDLDLQHRLAVTKSRCHPVADKTFPAHRAGELGVALREWLAGGAEDPIDEIERRLRELPAEGRATLLASLDLTTLTPRQLREDVALAAVVKEHLDAASPEEGVGESIRTRTAKGEPASSPAAEAETLPLEPAST